MVTPIPTGAFHISRQAMMQSLDFQEVARNSTVLDRCLSQATAEVEGFLHRGFFPQIATKRFDWPQRDDPVSWRLRLDDDELVTLTSASSGGVTISPANLLLYPDDGPPYRWLETSLGSSSIFQAGSTWQKAISLTGTWGYSAGIRSLGTLNGAINSSVTSLVLTDSSVAGVGNVLLLDSEYVVVRGQTQVTTGQTLQTPLTASAAGTTVAVTTGSAFTVGETILLDGEQMLIVDIAANTLIVKRAWNGTVLAAHTGSTIFAPRSYTVDRATCGSTAASHTTGITVYRHSVPSPVQALTLAEATWLYMNQSQGWQIAPGTTSRATTQVAALQMLQDLREYTRTAIGRKARQWTV